MAQYNVGEFRNNLKKAMIEADRGELVQVVDKSGKIMYKLEQVLVQDKGKAIKEILGRKEEDWIDRRIAMVDLKEMGYSEEDAWRMLVYGCGCRREGNVEECRKHGKAVREVIKAAK